MFCVCSGSAVRWLKLVACDVFRFSSQNYKHGAQGFFPHDTKSARRDEGRSVPTAFCRLCSFSVLQ